MQVAWKAKGFAKSADRSARAYVGGERTSEICSLKLSDIDPEGYRQRYQAATGACQKFCVLKPVVSDLRIDGPVPI